jgi:hypothetical protein
MRGERHRSITAMAPFICSVFTREVLMLQLAGVATLVEELAMVLELVLSLFVSRRAEATPYIMTVFSKRVRV